MKRITNLTILITLLMATVALTACGSNPAEYEYDEYPYDYEYGYYYEYYENGYYANGNDDNGYYENGEKN